MHITTLNFIVFYILRYGFLFYLQVVGTIVALVPSFVPVKFRGHLHISLLVVNWKNIVRHGILELCPDLPSFNLLRK